MQCSLSVDPSVLHPYLLVVASMRVESFDFTAAAIDVLKIYSLFTSYFPTSEAACADIHAYASADLGLARQHLAVFWIRK